MYGRHNQDNKTPMQITLRPWKEGDEENLVKYANNRNVARNLSDLFPHPYTPGDAKTWIAFNKDLLPALNLAIVCDEEVIGGVGIILKEDIRRKNAEIGYWIAESFWGKGIATQAVNKMVDYTFQHYDIARIYASTFDNNVASQRVLEKSGFRKEACLKKALFKNGRYMDEIIYFLLKEDYLQRTDKSMDTKK
jgi:RimJ/RimL family protein N-acetyltransferase